MKSLTVLNKESSDIQVEIGKLLLENYRFDHKTDLETNVIATLTTLRQHLAIVQREIRERLLA